MDKIFEFLERNGEAVYSVGSGLCAFIMAFLRTGGLTIRHLSTRITECFMCSMISSTSGLFIMRFFNLPIEVLLPLGTAVGYIGTGCITATIKRWLKNKTNANQSTRY